MWSFNTDLKYFLEGPVNYKSAPKRFKHIKTLINQIGREQYDETITLAGWIWDFTNILESKLTCSDTICNNLIHT